MTKPATPNLDKMLTVKDVSQEQGLFIDWLRATQGLTLARFTHYTDEDDPDVEHNCYPDCGWQPAQMTFSEGALNQLLAKYHGIDYDEMEAERMAIIGWVRAGYP